MEGDRKVNKVKIEGKTYSMEEAVKLGILQPTRHVEEKQESLTKRREKDT